VILEDDWSDQTSSQVGHIEIIRVTFRRSFYLHKDEVEHFPEIKRGTFRLTNIGLKPKFRPNIANMMVNTSHSVSEGIFTCSESASSYHLAP